VNKVRYGEIYGMRISGRICDIKVSRVYSACVVLSANKREKRNEHVTSALRLLSRHAIIAFNYGVYFMLLYGTNSSVLKR